MKRAYKYKIGEWVESHFRAPWKGTILRESDTVDGCYEVRVLVDRRGNPLRKPKIHHLNGGWLRKTEPKPEWKTLIPLD